MIRTGPNDALVEILKASGEWDDLVGGRGLRFTPAKGPPPPPPPPQFVIPRWDDPRDASSYVEPEPAPVASEEVPSRRPPARREPIDTGRPPSPTPRLDAWKAEQLKAAKP